jgi:glucokinase
MNLFSEPSSEVVDEMNNDASAMNPSSAPATKPHPLKLPLDFPLALKAAPRAAKKLAKKKNQKVTTSLSRPKKAATQITKVLAYDLGGTKVAVGVIDANGKVIAAHREPVLIKKGKKATIQQLIDLGKKFIKEYPEIKAVGVASAGPLDPRTGDLLDPTNFRGPDGPWGITPLGKILKTALKREIAVENDAASALLAEAWVGHAQDSKNAMIVTLGTGLGAAYLCDGELVRGAHSAHTEGGHMILKVGDTSAPCGCGNDGCAEGYLSGKSFTYRGRKIFENDIIDAVQIAARARTGDPKALAHFEEYAEMMAAFLSNCYMMFSMEVVIFTGSFAAASDLFLKNTENKLKKRMKRRLEISDCMPRLEISGLENQAGLLGGAYIALKKIGKL